MDINLIIFKFFYRKCLKNLCYCASLWLLWYCKARLSRTKEVSCLANSNMEIVARMTIATAATKMMIPMIDVSEITKKLRQAAAAAIDESILFKY